jgi:hypothetical protein
MKKKSGERAYSYFLERDASIARQNQVELEGLLECGMCCNIPSIVFEAYTRRHRLSWGS